MRLGITRHHAKNLALVTVDPWVPQTDRKLRSDTVTDGFSLEQLAGVWRMDLRQTPVKRPLQGSS